MNVTLDLVTFVIGVVAMACGAVATYMGASAAIKVQLARLEERTTAEIAAMKEHAKRTEVRADEAHDRLDRLFGRRGISPDSTR